MKLLVIVIAIAAVLIVGAIYYAQASPYRISAANAKQLITSGENDLVLDVRTATERNTLGFYPGSVHIQSADLERQMPVQFPNKGTRIIVYCNTGQRARMAAEKLHRLGYANTVYITSSHVSIM
jgi:phage shock protein E